MPCRPYGRSGARYSALPHCSRPLPTTSGHLGSPPHASRCSSTSSTRQLVGPLLFPSPLPLLTHAPWPPERTSEHAHTRDAPDPPALSLLSPGSGPNPGTPQTHHDELPWPVATSSSSSAHGLAMHLAPPPI